jgi:hypothetical protein
MPVVMKLSRPEKYAWQFHHHVDWDAPVCPAGQAVTTG